jgi:hypothetical protein
MPIYRAERLSDADRGRLAAERMLIDAEGITFPVLLDVDGALYLIAALQLVLKHPQYVAGHRCVDAIQLVLDRLTGQMLERGLGAHAALVLGGGC